MASAGRSVAARCTSYIWDEQDHDAVLVALVEHVGCVEHALARRRCTLLVFDGDLHGCGYCWCFVAL